MSFDAVAEARSIIQAEEEALVAMPAVQKSHIRYPNTTVRERVRAHGTIMTSPQRQGNGYMFLLNVALGNVGSFQCRLPMSLEHLLPRIARGEIIEIHGDIENGDRGANTLIVSSIG